MTPEALSDLHQRCFVVPRPWTAEEFRALLAQDGVFLETSAGGFALGRCVLDEVELLSIAVDPDQRRAGQGRALMSAFDATARARGGRSVFLEVAETNAPARALYAAAGFESAGRRPEYYRDPEGGRIAALILRKAL